jgi:formylmethanofuran dehydrogenase subunit E
MFPVKRPKRKKYCEVCGEKVTGKTIYANTKRVCPRCFYHKSYENKRK